MSLLVSISTATAYIAPDEMITPLDMPSLTTTQSRGGQKSSVLPKASSTLEKLPQEVRTMIYEFLLPERRIIDVGRLHTGLQQRPNHFVSLLTSCSQIRAELEAWFKIPRIKNRIVTTATLGLIDPEITTFYVEVDNDSPLYETNPMSELARNWSSLLKTSDAKPIQKLLVRVKPQEHPSAQSQNLHSNLWALINLFDMPNLRTIDIQVRDFGANGGSKDAFYQKVDQVQNCFVIPIGGNRHLCIPQKHSRLRRTQGSELSKLVLRVWDCSLVQGSVAVKRLLLSYNDKVDGSYEEGQSRKRRISHVPETKQRQKKRHVRILDLQQTSKEGRNED